MLNFCENLVFSKAIQNIFENYLPVTYDLKPQNGQTILTVTQGDYSKVGDGGNRFKDTTDWGGWQPIIEEIKN
jgi:hypothetical protein